LTVAAGGLTLIVLAVGAVASFDFVLELWHLRQLASEEVTEQESAARWFVDHPSARAIGRLVELELARIAAASESETTGTVYSTLQLRLAPTVEDSAWVAPIRACGSRAIGPLLECYRRVARDAVDDAEHLAALVESLDWDSGAARLLAAAIADEELARLRSAAAYALNDIGPRAEHVVPQLLDATRSTSPAVRQHALIALRGVAGAVAARGRLVELLADADARVRAEAVFCLGYYGKDAGDVIPALERLCSDDSVIVSIVAEWAIEQVRGEATR